MMEFVEMVAVRKAPEDEVAIHLITGTDDTYPDKQQSNLIAVEAAGEAAESSLPGSSTGRTPYTRAISPATQAGKSASIAASTSSRSAKWVMRLASPIGCGLIAR